MKTRSYFNIILLSTFLIEIIPGITIIFYLLIRELYYSMIEWIVLLSVILFSGIYTVSFILK